MSEGQPDDSDRSHEPTPEKLKRAREKGIPVIDLDTLIAIAGGLGVCLSVITAMAERDSGPEP